MMRAGIVASLHAHASITLVGEAGDGAEAIALYDRTLPDVALLDLQMPGMDGLDAVTQIRKRHPEARLIVLATYISDARITAALTAGAQSYLMKSAEGAELAQVVLEVHAGRHQLSPAMRQSIARQYSGNGPSARELQVLRLASVGRSNREIAAQLSLSEATVKSHISTLMMKLGARDRTHAVRLATQLGFIEI